MGCGSSQTYAEGEEYFIKTGANIKNSGKRIEGDGSTSYGALIIDPNIAKRHEWVFKISSGGGQFIIGIDEISMKSCDQMFTPCSSHPNYGYVNGDFQDGYIYSYNVNNKDSVYGKGYGIMNHCNDNITMILDTSSSTPILKYFVNDEYQGVAFRNITKECQYRMAVYMTKGKNDAVIELLNYSSTTKEEKIDIIDDNDKGEERFYKSHSKELIISDNGYIVTNPESGTNTSVYGWIVTKNGDKQGMYRWKFKINENGKTGFGIIEINDEKNRDQLPPLNDSFDDLFYLKTSLKNYGIESKSKCSGNESYRYGAAFKEEDIIEVILDCDGGYLSFAINDVLQGNAYRVDQNCCYRMAVVLGSNSEIELLSYYCK